MPQKNINLHGSASDKHRIALLLIDVINDFDFPEADQLLKVCASYGPKPLTPEATRSEGRCPGNLCK